ncbi:serine/threonine protein kinase [Mucilaginibacter sp. 14171R-50]|uniref:serine/threonine protein kinase n=1 Tax=Mucilaginibacter sp. 14171R-50 TaxID=2703789 RepID=UPI00138BC922|nr:serine/threonine-protein kinase [Mucilaginibacter sp. 14171R-50]QHS57536.1 serine/threonine protein kinase [Mucilaginibacter sp. 14171R-50]
MSKVFTITDGLENLGALRTGGQGSVYKGRRMGPVLTAIKLLPTPIHSESDDDRNFRNFSNEVAKLQKVNEEPNPNVVKILSSGITDSGSLPFIEMEYIEGPDLCELLQPPHSKVFMLKEVIRVADQLANALAHCHSVGVKHGDVKSNNVKYNVHTGNYVLLDFGLAVMTEEERRSSIRHAGAIEFMAPEQHDGSMLLQTDVYSYGIILYELLTGQVPFPLKGNGETGRNAIMLAHIESPVPDLLELRRKNLPDDWSTLKQTQEMQVPQWLLDVISKCLQKQPEARYASGVELHEAIINGSLSADGKLSTNAIQAENDRLQHLITHYQQTEAEKDKQLESLKALAAQSGARFNNQKGVFERNKALILVSKPALAGLVTLTIVLSAVFCYSFFKKDNAKEVVYIEKTDYLKPPFVTRYYNQDSVMKAAAAKAAAVKKAALKAKKPTIVTPPVTQEKKKKRKKFLGIF